MWKETGSDQKWKSQEIGTIKDQLYDVELA